MAVVDVIPGYLQEFGTNISTEGISDLQSVARYTNIGAFTPSQLEGSEAFAKALETSTTEIQEFVTAMEQGLNWLAKGAYKMADTYNHAEDRVTTRMSDVPSEPNLPPNSPELTADSPEPSTNYAPQQPGYPDWAPPGTR